MQNKYLRTLCFIDNSGKSGLAGELASYLTRDETTKHLSHNHRVLQRQLHYNHLILFPVFNISDTPPYATSDLVTSAIQALSGC